MSVIDVNRITKNFIFIERKRGKWQKSFQIITSHSKYERIKLISIHKEIILALFFYSQYKCYKTLIEIVRHFESLRRIDTSLCTNQFQKAKLYQLLEIR